MAIVKFSVWLEGRRKIKPGPDQMSFNWDAPPSEPEPPKEENLQAIYQRGRQKADEFYSTQEEPARPFDRAIWGVTEALNARGRDVDRRYVGRTWHDPLASVNDNDDIDRVITMMEWRARPSAPSSDHLRYVSGRYFSAPPSPQDANFQSKLDEQARKMIDEEIQRRNQSMPAGWTKLRRNTRAYEERVERWIETARRNVKQKWRESIQGEIEELKRRHDRYDRPQIESSQQSLEVMKGKLADIEALKPDSKVVSEGKPILQELESRINGASSRHGDEITRLEQLLKSLE